MFIYFIYNSFVKKIDLKTKSHHFLNLWFVLFAATLVLYVLWNKPLYYIVLNLRPIGFALAFVMSFCGIGSPLVRWLYPRQSKTDEILASFALGLGLTALFTFLLGILGIVNAILYSLWTLIGLALFVYTTLRRWRPDSLDFNIDIKGLNLLAILVLVPFLLQLIPPLVSPVVSTDSLQYHLLIPKIFLKMGKIGYIPSLSESNYPCMAEYIYLLVLPLAGDIVCKSIHSWTGIFLLLAMGRLIARVSPGSSRLFGPILFFSMPVVVIIFGWAWNDLFFVFFLVLSLSYLLDYQEEIYNKKLLRGVQGGSILEKSPPGRRRQKIRSLLMAGIMCGLALWLKYTFVLVFFALLPLLLIAIARWQWKWQDLLWFFIPIGVISSLVFVKNWVFTGNPFYPFLHSIFPSPYWNDAAASYFTNALRRWEIPDWNWTTYFSFPFRLTLKPLLIDVHTGILPLTLAPMFFFRSPNRGVSFLKTFVASYVVVWLLIQTETRSLLTMFAVFLCVVSIGLEQKIWSRKTFRRPLVFFLCLAFLTNLGITIVTNYHLTNPLRYFLGLESRESFLLREAESQEVYDWLNKNPAVGKVLLVGLPGPYYLERFANYSSIVDPPVVEALSIGGESSEKMRQKFLGLGISHVVINKKQYEKEHANGLYSWPDSQRRAFESFITNFCQPMAKFGNDIIYKIAPR